MDKITHEVREAQWKEIIRKCQERPQGQTAKAWLAENGISNKSYYYWLRKIRKEAYEEMKNKSLPAAQEQNSITFAEVPVQQDNKTYQQTPELAGFQPDAIIRFGDATVAVSNSISAELFGRIIEAVNHAR